MTDSESMSPDDLIALAKAGDREAFAELYEMTKTSVWRWAYRMIQDPTSAEEIVAECFVAMINQLPDLPSEFASLAGWLRRVAHNKSCDMIRRNQTRRKGMQTLRAQQPSRIAAPPDQPMEREETSQQVHCALNELPDEYQIVIQWRYMDDLTLEEISVRLDQSVSATNSLLYRARTRLRSTLNRHLDGVPVNCRTSSAQGSRE